MAIVSTALRRAYNLKHYTNTAIRKCIYCHQPRFIAMSASRLEKEVEELKTNPYYEKYAEKIASLQQTSPEEFLSRIDQRTQEKSKKPEAIKERNFSSLLEPKKGETPQNAPKQHDLNAVMKLELIQDKEPDEIKSIWVQYHIQKEHVIAATLPSKDFDRLTERATKHPLFLFALPRSQGYEFIMCQFEGNAVHFTPLLYYQVHKENAPECLTIVHYTELKESKGIVLMKGEYDKNVIDAKEAQCLANQLQLYYTQDDPSKIRLLEVFTSKPDEFKHMDLIKEIESLSL